MKTKVLALENKKTQKVKVTNFMIERFGQEQSFAKLRRAIGLAAADKYKIFKLAEIMMNGPEARALLAAKDDLIKTTDKKEQLSYTHPRVMELLDLDTGLEVDKLRLDIIKLPADFTPEDMILTSWLVDYVEEKKN